MDESQGRRGRDGEVEMGELGQKNKEDFFFFFLRDWSKLQIQRTAKRNRPTKDKRQETGDNNKDWCSNQRTQR